MDDDVKVYSAHQYSRSIWEPSINYLKNDATERELERVRKLREQGKVTLPTTIGKEKQVNPFLVIDNREEFTRYRKERDRG